MIADLEARRAVAEVLGVGDRDALDHLAGHGVLLQTSVT
jgi:hypothetical protein